MKEKWIQKALPPSSKGKLHKDLGVKPGKKISQAKLKKAENSKSPLISKRARLAETLKGLHKK